MQLQIVSDIHTEFYGKDQGRKVLQRIAKDTSSEVDAILIPGDLSTTKGLRYAFSRLCDDYKNVIYTPGNHEYYGSSKSEIAELLQEVKEKHSNLHILDRDVVEIEGQRFVGCTLWFPPTHFVISYPHYTNDMKLIKADRDKFCRLQHWILEEFSINREFLSREVQKGDVVLTHYIPCPEGIHPNWQGQAGNAFFMGDVTDIIQSNKPKLWTFGHTHDALEFKLGDTQFYCNPVGYPQESKDWNNSLVVEV